MNNTPLPSNDSASGDSKLRTVVGTVSRSAVLAAALGFAGMAGMAGCVAPANDRLAVNNTETLGTNVGLQESVTQYSPLATIGRREWAPLTYTVPVDSVVHARTYAPAIELTSKSARQRGAYPSVDTAYELGMGSFEQQIQEAAIAPFVGVGQGFAMFGIVFLDPRIHGDESPMMAYQRGAPEAVLRPAIREGAGDEPTGSEPAGETER